jgi:hypothetical protein
METYTRSSLLVAWGLVFAWIGVIVTTSLISMSTIHGLDLSAAGMDRTLHAVSYGVLAIFLVRALAMGGIQTGTANLLTLAAVLALGGAIEIVQPAVGRSADIVDWLADGIGAAATLFLRAAWLSIAARPA